MTRGPELGVLQWFWSGERDRVEEVLADLRTLGITRLRTGVSWADWYTSYGVEWYSWLLPRLAKEVEVLPCFLYTPPSLGVTPKASAPPRNPRDYADFLDDVITRYGRHFEWVELWNEPNNVSEWDWTLDPEWRVFCQMIGGAAYWARARGKKTVLGGMSPTDPHWLRLMFDRGVMGYIDAVGIHGFPGIWERTWEGWPANVHKVRDVLEACRSATSIWITEVGFSTWRHEEHRQVLEFLRAAEAPVERLYWYSARDLDPNHPTVDGFHSDEREYHFGLARADGSRKLLCRAWADGGIENVRRVARLGLHPGIHVGTHPITLITGGAGFIGARLADRIASTGRPVVIFDSFDRPGAEDNAEWLRDRYPGHVRIVVADVRNRFALREALESVETVYHLVAPAEHAGPADLELEFDVVCRGTLNVLLEAARRERVPDILFVSAVATDAAEDDVFASCETDDCARLTAEAWVHNAARRHGFRAAVLRLGDVYGVEVSGRPAGWPGDLALALARGEPSPKPSGRHALYPLLAVEEAVRELDKARSRMDTLAGGTHAVTGGAASALSGTEVLRILSGDRSATSDEPHQTDVREGLARLRRAALRYPAAPSGEPKRAAKSAGARR